MKENSVHQFYARPTENAWQFSAAKAKHLGLCRWQFSRRIPHWTSLGLRGLDRTGAFAAGE